MGESSKQRISKREAALVIMFIEAVPFFGKFLHYIIGYPAQLVKTKERERTASEDAVL
jgi:hypothetical protein